MDYLGFDCCVSPKDSSQTKFEDRFYLLSDGEDLLPAGKLHQLLELTFDHIFTKEESERLAKRTGSHGLRQLFLNDNDRREHGRLPELKFTLDECEYMVDLAEQRYPYLDLELEMDRQHRLFGHKPAQGCFQ